jgi:hypothetical protein
MIRLKIPAVAAAILVAGGLTGACHNGSNATNGADNRTSASTAGIQSGGPGSGATGTGAPAANATSSGAKPSTNSGDANVASAGANGG